jgi:hypothetical protein
MARRSPRALRLLPQMAMGNVKSMLSQSTDRDQSVQDKLMVQPDKAWAKEQEHVVKQGLRKSPGCCLEGLSRKRG